MGPSEHSDFVALNEFGVNALRVRCFALSGGWANVRKARVQ